MAISSSLALNRISTSSSSLKSSLTDTKRTTSGISRSLSTSTQTKKRLSSDILSYKKRRFEFGQRISFKNKLITPTLITRQGGARSLTLSDTSTSISDRLLGFIGYLSAGWILSNMPTWIRLGEQFTSRLVTAGFILSNYTDESISAMNGAAKVFGAALQNISRFDFTDSSGILGDSLSDLKTQIDALSVGLSEAFAVLLKPFKDIPEPGTYQPDEPDKIPPPGPGGGGNRATAGTKEQRAALDAISFAEGTTGKNGYSTWAGYQKHGPSDLTGLTIRQVHDLQTTFITSGKVKKTGSAVVGRYQFLTPYNQAKAAGLNPETDKFSPENQDRMAIHIMNQVGATDAVLKKEGISSRVSAMLGSQWAPFPGSPFGQQTKSLKSIQEAYKKSLGSTQQVSAPSPANFLANLGSPASAILNMFNGQTSTGQRRLQIGDVFTKSLGKDVSLITISDVVGTPRESGRTHGGIDITAPLGTYIALRVDCEVVASGTYGDYGLLIDVWIPSLGIQLRMTHLSSVLIKSGKIPAGTSFARVGQSGRATGPHIHLEYDTQKGTRGGGARNDDPNYAANLDGYVRLLLLTKNPNKGQFSTPSKPSTPLVPGVSPIQIESGADFEMEEENRYLTQMITMERKGRKVIIIDDRKNVVSQQIITSNDGDMEVLQIPDSVLLNNFIKNKLLLDLNYL